MHAPEILRRTRRRRTHPVPRLRATDLRNTVWWLEAVNTVLWLGVSYLVFRLAGGTFDQFGDQFAAVLAVENVHDIPNAWLAGALVLFGIPFMTGIAGLSANTGTQRRFDAWYLRQHPPANRIGQAQGIRSPYIM